jgi:hypothetical protein
MLLVVALAAVVFAWQHLANEADRRDRIEKIEAQIRIIKEEVPERFLEQETVELQKQLDELKR